MENQVALYPAIQEEASQYGIEMSKAKDLIGNLPQITSERDELAKQYDEVIKMDIDNPATQKAARELRLRIKDNRTKGLVVWHKTTKDYYLKAGQFVDAIKRKEEAVNTRMEDNLEKIEKHLEIKRQQLVQELRTKRAAEISQYKEFVPMAIDLGTISDEEYTKVFNGAKLQYEYKIQEERKQEEAKREAQRLAELKQQKINLLMPYMLFIDNYSQIDFDSISMDECQGMVEQAQKIKAKKDAEAAESRKKLAAEREKAAKAKAEMDKKLQAEREQREKLERELREKKEAEEKAERERLEAERKLKNASDKTIVLDIADRIEKLQMSFPEVKGDEAKAIVEEAIGYLNRVSKNMRMQAESEL